MVILTCIKFSPLASSLVSYIIKPLLRNNSAGEVFCVCNKWSADCFYRRTTLWPKGNMAYIINLKCCRPKGIPMIVIQNTIPNVRCVRATSIPPKIIHNTFINTGRQPITLSVGFTSPPKGHKANIPKRIICTPNGIPTIVKQRINPPKR